MKRLLQILLIISLVLIATYYFSVDGVIRSMVENEASKALKAQVNIAGANFRLLGGKLTLDGVQLTNPRAPLRNLAQADSVSLDLNFAQLLSRKFVADQVEIRGLRFDQARAVSGAIEGLTPQLAPPAAPLTQTPSAQATPFSQGNLTATNNSWQQRLQFLADESTVNQLRERARQLRMAKSPIALAQFRQEVRAQLSQLQVMREELNRDAQRAQQNLTNAQPLPASTFGQPAQQNGNGPADNVNTQLGRHIKDSLNQLLALSASARAAATESSDQWFALARKVQIDGEYDFGATPLRFEASIDNATPQPGFWKLPMIFILRGKPDQTGSIDANGSLDLLSASGQMDVTLDQLPVTALPLDAESGLNLVLDKALASGTGHITLKDNQVDLKFSTRFQQAVLNAAAPDNAAAQTLRDALRGVSDFDLDVLASGAVQNPGVDVRSSIGRQLAGVLSAQGSGDLQRARDLLAAREQALNEIARDL